MFDARNFERSLTFAGHDASHPASHLRPSSSRLAVWHLPVSAGAFPVRKRRIAVKAAVVQLNWFRWESHEMATGYDLKSPEAVKRASQLGETDWAETGVRSLTDLIQEYARNNPLTFGLWALGIGFVLGWKLKPW